MNAHPRSVTESHAQRVLRLQREYQPRYERYEHDPEIRPLLRKLMLIDPSADNSLSPDELDALDKKLEPLRKIRARFNKLFPLG